ncbi:S-layer homology domain-containing protein [Paenibacillus elgii]|uniref:S-layer homology domain-containing protein n=1 Tax=Paenibacillus elgii TaxID=189691 RepID=UPI0030DD1379
MKTKKMITTMALTTAVTLGSLAPIHVLNVQAAASFTDVSVSAPYQTALEALEKSQVVQGYGQHDFRPSQAITRAELATMAAKAFKLQAAGQAAAWSDVKASDWFHEYVNAVVGQGAMSGENGSFKPNDSLSQDQLIAIVAKASKADAATLKNALGTAYSGSSSMTRGEAAIVIHAALQVASIQVTEWKAVNPITLQITFSAPLPKEEIDVEKAKANFTFDNGLTPLNIPQLKSGSKSTYILPVSPQKAGTTYTFSYKGKKIGTFEAMTNKISMNSAQQVASDTFEIESKLEDGVTDYGNVVVAYQGKRGGLEFSLDDNNMYNGKTYQLISSMRGKQVTITPENGEPIVASYVPFTQATDGRQAPKFRLPEGQTLKPGVKYTVTSDWSTVANPTFTAKEIAPLQIQSVEQADAASLNVTLSADPQDELFALRSIVLTAADGTKLNATYRLTSRKGAVGTFDLQNGGKLTSGTTYTVAPLGNWATAANVTLTAK